MQSRFLATILLSLCVAHGVLSIPLEVAPEAPASNDSERENEARINAATELANKNILKMEHVLDHPNEPGHQEMIDAAFGKDPSLDMKEVKTTVQNLKNGPPVKIKLPTDPNPAVIAYTKFVGDATPLTPDYASFGAKYHSEDTSDEARAATLIHEATHSQSSTGDNIVKGKVLPGSDKRGSRTQMYTSEMEPYKTAQELNDDVKWAKLRDEGQTYWGDRVPATKDMHKAAEAYGQFSSMCGAAVSDAAVGLRRRAMAAGKWDEAAIHLIRRQACSLPKKEPAATKEAATDKNKVPESKDAKASSTSTTKKSLSPKSKTKSASRSKSDKGASRLRSGKKSKGSNLGKKRKASVGKSALSRSKKGAAGGGSKVGAQKSRRVKPVSKGLASKGSAKPLANGRARAGKGKVPSRSSTRQRPTSAKKSLGRPSSKKGTNGLKKNVARPTSKKNVGRPTSKNGSPKKRPSSSNLKKLARPASSKKNIARPASSKKGLARPSSSKKNIARPATSKNNKSRPPKKNVSRPTSKSGTSKKNVARPAPSKNSKSRSSGNKNSAKPSTKAPAPRQQKSKVVTPGKGASKAAPFAKTSASKKIRRDLDFEFQV